MFNPSKLVIFFLAFFILSGCTDGKIHVNLSVKKASESKVVNQTATEKRLHDALRNANISKGDALIIFKQFAGISEYMKLSGNQIDSTDKLWKVISRFQTDYKYERKNNSLSDEIEKILMEAGFKKVKKIVGSVSDAEKEISRDSIVTLFQELANGTWSYVTELGEKS